MESRTLEEVKHVLQHEIAHHFGISDQGLKDLDVY
ncbi:MAG: metallopeptidase family protein [Candidatus Omnitrophica bacterium]|nr:metallopeptidase family protein [Candidatus Omnitrophota bacterium]